MGRMVGSEVVVWVGRCWGVARSEEGGEKVGGMMGDDEG